MNDTGERFMDNDHFSYLHQPITLPKWPALKVPACLNVSLHSLQKIFIAAIFHFCGQGSRFA